MGSGKERGHVPWLGLLYLLWKGLSVAKLFGWFQLHCNLRQKWRMLAQKTPPFMAKHMKEGPEMAQVRPDDCSPFSLEANFFLFRFAYLFLMAQYSSLLLSRYLPPIPHNQKSSFSFSGCLCNLYHWEIDLFIQISMSSTAIWTEIDFFQALSSWKIAENCSPCSHHKRIGRMLATGLAAP